MAHFPHHPFYLNATHHTAAANEATCALFLLASRFSAGEFGRGFAGQSSVRLGGRRCGAGGCPARGCGDCSQQLLRAGVPYFFVFVMTQLT